MDLYKLNFTILQQEILRFLIIHAGVKFTQNQIATSLEVSPAAISKSLSVLKTHNLITVSKDKDTKRLSIMLNRDNPKVVDLKRVENLKILVESGFLFFLREKFPGKQIILFGSYSRGEDIEKSDIDIAVIGKEKAIDTVEFEKMLCKSINFNFYDSLPSGTNLKNNIFTPSEDGGFSGWVI